MSKICPSCNTQCQDTELYCPNCGTRLANVPPAAPSWQPQQPQQTGWQPQQNSWQPQPGGWQPPQQPTGYRPAPGNALSNKNQLLKIVSIALLVVAVLNLVFGMIFLIGKYNTNMKYDVAGISGDLAGMSGLGLDIPTKMNISDVYELASEEDVFGGLHAINILYGLVLLALAAFSAFLWLQINNRSHKVPQLFTIYAIAGLVSVLLYMLLFHICGTESESMYGMTMKVWIPYHFYTWLHLIYSIAVTAFSFVVLPKAKAEFNR